MRYASGRGLEKKAAHNNNLPTQTNDVMVNPRNPVNPDSKPGIRSEFYFVTYQWKDEVLAHRRKGGLKVILRNTKYRRAAPLSS